MNEFILKVKKYFSDKISSPSKITKAIKECDENLMKEISEYLEKYPEYEKISYLISAICRDFDLKKCLFCGKLMTYTQSKNHNYCSNLCAQRSEEVTNKRVKSFLIHKEELNSQRIGRLFYDSNITSLDTIKINENRFNANKEELLKYFTNLGCQINIDAHSSDIFIIGTQLVFDFCGNYWNNIHEYDKNYHLNKLIEYESKGFRLITLFEYQWILKKEVIKEKIKALLGIYDKVVYARCCKIIELKSKAANFLLNKTHIQGSDKSSMRLGLLYNNEVVAAMTFGKPRFNAEYEYELIRYSTNCHVLGGAGKLLNYFIKVFKPSGLVTYADRCWSCGNLYKSLGFKNISSSGPNYVYVKDNLILTRYQCQKHKLEKVLGKDIFNKELSESDNMYNAGFVKIYDCGNLTFAK